MDYAERYSQDEADEDAERALAQGDQNILEVFTERTIAEYEAQKSAQAGAEQNEEPEA